MAGESGFEGVKIGTTDRSSLLSSSNQRSPTCSPIYYAFNIVKNLVYLLENRILLDQVERRA